MYNTSTSGYLGSGGLGILGLALLIWWTMVHQRVSKSPWYFRRLLLRVICTWIHKLQKAWRMQTTLSCAVGRVRKQEILVCVWQRQRVFGVPWGWPSVALRRKDGSIKWRNQTWWSRQSGTPRSVLTFWRYHLMWMWQTRHSKCTAACSSSDEHVNTDSIRNFVYSSAIFFNDQFQMKVEHSWTRITLS